MFNAVYLHKTIFGFEELVRNTIKILIDKDKTIYKTEKDIRQLILRDNPNFLYFDDSYLDGFFDKYAKQNDGILSVFCRAIKHRQPPKLVHEEYDLQQENAGVSKKFTLFQSFLQHDLDRAARACKIKRALLFWREPKDVRFEASSPFIGLSGLKDVRVEELKGLVKVIGRDNKVTYLVEEPCSIIYHLGGLQYKSVRLYAVGITESQLQKLRQKIQEKICN